MIFLITGEQKAVKITELLFFISFKIISNIVANNLI